MDFLLMHLGCVVHFQTLHSTSSNGGVITVLSASVYKYQSHDKTFKKISCVNDDMSLQIEIAGHFQLLQVSKADSETSGVVEPFVLLGCCSSKTNNSNFDYFLLYQIMNMQKLLQVYEVDRNLTGTRYSVSVNSRFFICDGPAVIAIDSCSKSIHCFKLVDETVTRLSASFEFINGTVFNFKSCSNENSLECQFSSQYSDAVQDKARTPFLKWTNVMVEFQFFKLQIDINYNKFTDMPDMYCRDTKALVSGIELENSYFLSTSRSQLVVVRSGKVDGVCDIPFQNCNSIFVAGKENLVAVLLDSSKKEACALNLDSLKIIKEWNNLTGITSGIFASDEGVKEHVLILQSLFNNTCIEFEEYSLISNSEDVSQFPKKKVEEFPLKQLSIPMDTECDLFSSPGITEDRRESFEVLTKVVKSLTMTVNKHKSAVEQLRCDLKHCRSVATISKSAICQMNNNISLSENPEKLKGCNAGMIDFFTGEPCFESDCLEDKSSTTMLKLCKSWQRVVLDVWILGFDFVNQSEKRLCDFGIALSPSGPVDILKVNTISGSNITKLIKENCVNHAEKNEIPTGIFKSDENTTSMNNVVEPSGKFTITTQISLRNFEDFREQLLSVALIATVNENVKNNNEDSQNVSHIFNLGKVSLTATEIVGNLFSLDANNLKSINSDGFYDDIKAMLAYRTHEQNVDVTSSRTDAFVACKSLLQSVGFEKLEELHDEYVCTRLGPFYLSSVKLQLKSKTFVSVKISSKSEFEAFTLVKYFNEQLSDDFKVIKTHS